LQDGRAYRMLVLLVIIMQKSIFSATSVLFSWQYCLRSLSVTAESQGRNHVFIVGGPILWSIWYYYPFTEKIDRSTQFVAVGDIITLYSSKSYVKSCGVRPNFGSSGPPDPPVVAPMLRAILALRLESNFIII